MTHSPPASMPMVCWYLDSPDVTKVAPNPEVFELGGWIAAQEPIGFPRLAEEDAARLLPFSRTDRADVVATYGLPAIGFTASCRYEKIRHRGVISLLCGVQGREIEIVVPVYRPPGDARTQKQLKRERLLDVVQCPRCGSAEFEARPEALHCRGCDAVFPCGDTGMDFLTPELRAQFNIVPTDNVSSMDYDGEALNIIHRLRDGLILDCGAGLRGKTYANVVNFEIVPYETTDVLGVGEKMPFKDDSFDAVFSFAVLEHVKDPFACGREMSRVLKPGGTLYCQVPFLQPLHGYPHHYHNMSITAALGLFGSEVRVDRAGPFLFGQPVFALSWILNRYVEGLAPDAREAFKSMRVEELLKPPSQNLGAPFVTALSSAAREELSCCNAVIGTKVR